MCVSVYISQLDQPPENFIRNIDFANVFDLYYPSLYNITILLCIYGIYQPTVCYLSLVSGILYHEGEEQEVKERQKSPILHIEEHITYTLYILLYLFPLTVSFPPPRHVRPKSTIIALAPIYQKIYHALCGGCYVENDGDQSETTMVTIRTKLTKNTSLMVAWDALKIYQLFTTLTDT